MSKNIILIMAGGTGGHILPALAVANALQAKSIEVHWLGTQNGLEQQLVLPTGIPLHCINVRGIRRKGIKNLLMTPFQIFRAVLQAIKIIRKLQPSKVIGFGGFVSGPGGIAAWLLRKPLIIHEQNAAAGLTNRCLAPLASEVFQAFPYVFSTRIQAVTCGNPVRAEILALPSPESRFEQRLQNSTLRLLVLGGSQGAALFNQMLPETLNILSSLISVEVWHSAGKNAAEKTLNFYQQLKLSAKVVDFIEDISTAYAWADLVICRAGALTIAELAAAGVGSILIPYPHAVDDHQTKNATWLVNAGAAILIQQNTLNVLKLAEVLTKLTTDKNKLLKMALAARSLAITDATQKIVLGCLK